MMQINFSIENRLHGLVLREEYAFQLGIQFRGVHAHFAAEAALFVAAEGGFSMDTVAGIDREDPGAHTLCHAQGAAQILGPDRA